MTNEQAIKNSFRLVKGDIIRIQGELLAIKEQQARILEKLDELGFEERELEHKIEDVAKKKPATKISKKRYLASKESTKFHIPHCPYAKNIKPKSKLIFKTKESALNQGYKPCSCV